MQKNIPFGAGLGGGSADASFTLKALNEIFSLSLSDDILAGYASKLGADCPFFIYNKPMLATGIGTELSPIELSLEGYKIEWVKPNVHVSTADAYRHVKPKQPAFDLRELPNIPVEEWKDCLVNDFEESVFAQYPKLADIKQDFYTRGAIYAAMSGSGSTIFGIFKELV
jgi:4-diphosphocytidyl-2-C-methyl-D-erythritol kinase